MFQLKDFASISASMINRAKATQTKITDFNVGSVARTLLESPAIEIEELYQRIFAGIMEAIPVAIYKGFEFALLEPTKARGLVYVGFAGPIAEAFTVPKGTIFLAPETGLRYLSSEDVAVAVGSTSVWITVDAANVGSAYNADANAITSVSGYTFPQGSTIGSQAITSGSDGESEVERAARFAAFIQSIARGTLASVEYGASSAVVLDESGAVTEFVSRVGSSEVPGRVDVYIYGSGGVASADLIAAAQKIVDGYYDADLQRFVPGYRPAGVDALVLPMLEQPYNLTVTVDLLTGYTLTTALQNEVITAVSEVISAVVAGQTLFVESLVEAALMVPGIRAVRLSATENYPCPPNAVLTPGTITVQLGG